MGIQNRDGPVGESMDVSNKGVMEKTETLVWCARMRTSYDGAESCHNVAELCLICGSA
jgi:hypothetical protein